MVRTAYVNAESLEIVGVDYGDIGVGVMIPSFQPPEGSVGVVVPDELLRLDILECYRTEDGQLALRYHAEKKDALLQYRMEELRGRRAELLRECDWVGLSDIPLPDSVKQAWVAYRQALRDLPQTVDTNVLLMGVYEVGWPVRP